MNEKEIMSEEAFKELIDNLESVEKLTLYGRKAIKYWVNKLQKENEKKDKQIEALVKYIDSNNYITSNSCDFQDDFKIEKCIDEGNCKDCIRKYFEEQTKN